MFLAVPSLGEHERHPRSRDQLIGTDAKERPKRDARKLIATAYAVNVQINFFLNSLRDLGPVRLNIIGYFVRSRDCKNKNTQQKKKKM